MYLNMSSKGFFNHKKMLYSMLKYLNMKSLKFVFFVSLKIISSCKKVVTEEAAHFSPDSLEYMPKGGIEGIKAEIYMFLKAYNEFFDETDALQKTVNTSYPDRPLNESIWIIEASTNTFQSSNTTDAKYFKSMEYEIEFNNLYANNELYFSGNELITRYDELKDLIEIDMYDGSRIKFTDVYLKEVGSNKTLIGVRAKFAKGNKPYESYMPKSGCIWQPPSNIDWSVRVPPPRFPEGPLYDTQDNWKWGSLLGKCDGTNVGQDAASILSEDINFYWSHMVVGVPLINVQTLSGNTLDYFVNGSVGNVGEFKGSNLSTSPANVTFQEYTTNNYPLGQYWLANEIPNVSTAFVSTHPSNIQSVDNYRNFQIYDSQFASNSPAFVVNTDCLDDDELHFYYCEMREALETIRPKAWSCQGPLEFISVELRKQIFTNTFGNGVTETEQYHFFEDIVYGIPLLPEYADKGYFIAY
jgi:hypothetical protein